MFDDNGPLWLLVTLGFPVGIALVMVVRELRLLVRLRRPRTPAMTSAPVPREPADPPSVNVLRSSLALFSLYIATTVIVSLALAAASIDLHPATRFFIWLVMSAAVGYGLLRRHGRYPSPPTLGLILGLAIFWILGMSVAATLRLDDSAEALTPQLGAFAFNTVALLLVGAAGLQLARAIFSRRNRAR